MHRNDSIYDFLKELLDNGSLRKLHKLGLLSYKVFLYIDLCEDYDIQRRLGKTKMEAVNAISEKYKIHQGTVYRALEKLGYESRSSNTNNKREAILS